jgi:hypothetical protein
MQLDIYVAMQYSAFGKLYCIGLTVSTTALIIQQATGLAPLLGQLARYAAMAAMLLVFRPLLVGMLRAALLLIRPRLSREERAARAHMRDMRAMQNMINSSSGPSHAAELRAIAARA